ncbi:histidinol-phosphate aminotransferase [Virgibacillus halotolerans]|uniref:histidinol-phosphate transaminase n=1 Tax=Virgibacillus halotolerans TaxID=1071053 RepID=UPI00196214C6|nr:histidinol-phosphate transaminase [Virgibacillus halotolerans]MBM7598363.1 histidinol-phosphate aminotransferase [Virgibacillus halotolerans]
MNNKSILNELSPYKPGKQVKEIKEMYGLNQIVKLASNENPYGFSENVKDYVLNSMHEFNIYPDGYTSELRTAVAAKLKINEKQLVFGNGSDEIVQIICRAYIYPGVNTVMATPTFPQYKQNALIEGAQIKEIPTIDGYHDLEGMLTAIDENTNVVWLCSPNNPTGSIIEKETLHSFLDRCPKNVLVVLDEAYYEYMESDLDAKMIEQLSAYPNLVILRTFSKAYGLAGLRVGYAVASEQLITKLDVARGPFNTSTLAQNAALIALEDDQFIQSSRAKNNDVKQAFQQFLTSIGWHYYDSQTNFLLVSTPISGEAVFQYLIENGFIVRPGELLGCPNTIRITLGHESDMKQIQDLLYQLDQEISKENE